MLVEGSEIKHLRKAVSANGNMFLRMCFCVLEKGLVGAAFFIYYLCALTG